MLFAVLSVLFVIYPLKDTPVLGNSIQSYDTPLADYELPTSAGNAASHSSGGPSWYTDSPIGMC